MNEEMAEKLSQATTVAEVQAVANSYGYELTVEQAQEVFDKIQSFSADGELSDDMLEAVTGGLAGGSIRKRDVHGHPLTYGPEGYIVPLK